MKSKITIIATMLMAVASLLSCTNEDEFSSSNALQKNSAKSILLSGQVSTKDVALQLATSIADMIDPVTGKCKYVYCSAYNMAYDIKTYRHAEKFDGNRGLIVYTDINIKNRY